MSSFSSDSSDEDSQQEYTYKRYGKIDPDVKLRVIRALDKGLPKDKIAKKYAVHLPTIDYIYKQKHKLLNKFELDDVNTGISYTTISEHLLSWLVIQTRSGKFVGEQQLKEKALEIAPEMDSIDDWLLDFRMRHNVLKHETHMEYRTHTDENWVKISEENAQNFYIGGICAISHSLDLISYLQEKPVDEFMSVFYISNVTGLDKRKLQVIGSASLQASQIKSHPANYYYCKIPQFSNNIIEKYLTKWDIELKSNGKSIYFIMDISNDVLKKISLGNIKLVRISENNFVSKSIQQITECFKFNYRKLQAIKNIVYQKKLHHTVDYLDILSAAWHSVPEEYMRKILCPLKEGSLYFKTDEEIENISLSQWLEKYNISLDIKFDNEFLDKFVSCDGHLKCLDYTNRTANCEDLRSEFLQSNSSQIISSTAGIEAYQAMKRIVLYLQGETSDLSLINNAKFLENYTETGALNDLKTALSNLNDE